MDSDRLGALLRRYRERALLTQEELAARAGMSARTIRRLESAELRRPRVASVRLLAGALGLSTAEQATLMAAARDGGLPVDTEPVVIPRQVPAAPAPFIGRLDELARLDATLAAGPPIGLSAEGTPSGSTPQEAPHGRLMLISAIGGTGGIGKTWLALHWAHHHLNHFPDGHLFVDLRGFSPTGQPARPADVLGGFLDALGIDRQPTDLDRRADLYRSLVANKRMLILLDNAATTDQVTPLLPGGHRCTVLITSRNQLRGLIARHGARPVHLDVLTDIEAHALLAHALGPSRTAADASAVAELIELCGRFPLALGVIAARAAADPHLPLGDTVTELRTLGLEALDSEDPTASLPAVLSWSLRHLTHQQRQVFALLGIAPGPDIGLPATAALTGLPERETHAVLRALAETSLINRTPGSRYGMHDLVRAYTTSIADDLPAGVRETALRRVLDFYTHTAHTAQRLLDSHRERELTRLDPPAAGVHPHPLPDTPAAMAWFDAEHACLLAAQHTATTLAWHPTVWHLAWALQTFLYRRGHRHDQLTVWQAAAHAATHLPDPTSRTLAHRYLGLAHAYLGHHEDALNHLHQALTHATHHHDVTQQARTQRGLAYAWSQREDYQQALDHARRALDLYRGLDHPVWEADALNAVGWYAARLGDYDTARAHCQAALTLFRHHHSPVGEAYALDSLGYIDHHSSHHHQAINHYHHTLTLSRDLGNTYEIATTLDGLGHPHAALGQTEQARTVWQEALQLYREQARHDDAARVQHQLDNLDTQAEDDQPPS